MVFDSVFLLYSQVQEVGCSQLLGGCPRRLMAVDIHRHNAKNVHLNRTPVPGAEDRRQEQTVAGTPLPDPAAVDQSPCTKSSLRTVRTSLWAATHTVASWVPRVYLHWFRRLVGGRDERNRRVSVPRLRLYAGAKVGGQGLGHDGLRSDPPVSVLRLGVGRWGVRPKGLLSQSEGTGPAMRGGQRGRCHPRRRHQGERFANFRTRSRGNPVCRLVLSRSKEPRWN